MCHLGPFSQNPAVLNINPITRFFGSRHLAVDCLHFLNHKDKVNIKHWLDIWMKRTNFQNCQYVYDPYVPELNPVNTVICEQSFAWSNQYSNVMNMNGPRFNHFFHYLLDLHNLKVCNLSVIMLIYKSINLMGRIFSLSWTVLIKHQLINSIEGWR